jgi:hypothetical protein
MDQPSLPPLGGRPDRTTVTMAALLAGVTVAMLVAVYLMMGGSETPAVRAKDGHQFGAAAPTAQTPMPLQNPLPQAQPPQGQPGSASDSLAFITNREPFPQVAGNGPVGTAGVSAAERSKEKQFLAQYDGMIRQYQTRLGAICMRYREKFPIVRKVDEDFGGLSRYMAVKRRYEADRDLYQWARDTAALPEVRTTIRKYLSNSDAWKVAIDMSLEALKQPPPAPVYKEVQRMLLTDPVMRDITDDISRDVTPNMGPAVLAMAGKDVTPLKQVVADLGLEKK